MAAETFVTIPTLANAFAFPTKHPATTGAISMGHRASICFEINYANDAPTGGTREMAYLFIITFESARVGNHGL